MGVHIYVHVTCVHEKGTLLLYFKHAQDAAKYCQFSNSLLDKKLATRATCMAEVTVKMAAA